MPKRTNRTPKSNKIYQLKLILLGVKPSIWRRVAVRADATLGELHEVIQRAMGWTNSHLHQFIVGEDYYGPPNLEDMERLEDERKMTLEGVATEGTRFVYEY